MRNPIDPKIDCVFKALLGAEPNRRLLVHFLNAVLGTDLATPVVEVEILNPYNEREFLDDKLSIVDVKTRDALGRVFQVEIQLLVVQDLLARILYGWADLYSGQIKEGQGYGELKPTYSIWLLGETLVREVPGYAHRFRMRDEQGRALIDHGGIYLLELCKFARAHAHAHAEDVANELERWLRFFTEAERLDADALPDWMQTEEMQQAMSTLKAFTEKERAYHAYQARQNFLRQERSTQRRMAELTAAEEHARTQLERAHMEAEQAQMEAEQARMEAEQARMQAEQARMESEQARMQAEQARMQAEQARMQAEQAHLESGQARIQAEQALIQMEREREEKEQALAEIERLERLARNHPSQ
jgi:predicted transposase/invertase (TIGR01784 family)